MAGLALCAVGLLAAVPGAASIDARATCTRIAEAADEAGLPAPFLARLIWTESRFDPRAVSPKGALGVAQFIPETAARRGLADPFDHDAAIAASARYLADLRQRFGNLGLAAAAYNAGEGRVERWLAQGGALPDETERYVSAITGRPAAWFRRRGREAPQRPLARGAAFLDSCADLPTATLRAARPWRVALATGLSRADAAATLDRMRRHYEALFAPHGLALAHNPNRRRGAWSVVVEAPSWSRAVRLCERLQARDGACAVLPR
jgi:hypothetical protein